MKKPLCCGSDDASATVEPAESTGAAVATATREPSATNGASPAPLTPPRRRQRGPDPPQAAAQEGRPALDVLDARGHHRDGHDGVGALGHGRAGENAHGGGGRELARRVAAAALAAQRQYKTGGHQVGGAHGIAVHGGGIERRLRQQRGEGSGQRAPVRSLDGDALGLRGRNALDDAGQRLFDREGRGHGYRFAASAAR